MFYFFIMIIANKEFQTKKPLLTDKVRLFGIFQVNLMFLWHKQIANFFPQNVLMSSTHLHQVFDWCRCLVDEVVEATQAHYTRASLWNLRLYLPQMNWEECRVMVKNDTLYNTWVRKAIPINYLWILRVPTSLVTQNSMYFPGYFQVNAMKSQVNLSLNQCLCWKCRYDKDVNQILLVMTSWKVNLEKHNLQRTSFFQVLS